MDDQERDRLLHDMRRALWGPEDAGHRSHEPGLVALVYELKAAADKRKAITGFLTTAVSIIGFGNIVLIVYLVLMVIGGGAEVTP